MKSQSGGIDVDLVRWWGREVELLLFFLLSKRFLGSLEWAEEKVRKKEAQTGSSHPSSVNDCTEELSHQRGRGGADKPTALDQPINRELV